METPPLALYVHFPWCVRKCPYCDFNSHESRGAIPEQDYLAALIADLDAALPLIEGRRFVSAFIGGGTPSLMAAETVAALLAPYRQRRLFAEDAEITLEANPGTVEAAKFAGFRAAGVNRLSLGIQSFDDAKLAALGRIHSAAEARRAAELALAHFDNVNLDLMYALPGQTPDEARRDIEMAIALGPTHISAYHLTLEPNTPFHHAPPPLPDDDLAADMQDMVEERLAAAGYEHYETSAFARPGFRCRHNINYWEFGDYLGIGAGAHSKLSLAAGPPQGEAQIRAREACDRRGPATKHPPIVERSEDAGSPAPGRGLGGGVFREARPRGPKDYLADPVTRHWQGVVTADLPGEFMMNTLRLADGFAPALFEQRTGLPLAVIEKSALAARCDGLLEVAPDRIRPTARGRRFLNTLLARFLPE